MLLHLGQCGFYRVDVDILLLAESVWAGPGPHGYPAKGNSCQVGAPLYSCYNLALPIPPETVDIIGSEVRQSPTAYVPASPCGLCCGVYSSADYQPSVVIVMVSTLRCQGAPGPATLIICAGRISCARPPWVPIVTHILLVPKHV